MVFKLLVLLFSGSIWASINVGPQQVIPGLAKGGLPSYFVNPSCEKNDIIGITDTDNIVTRVSSGGLGDLGTDCQIDADASGEKAVFAWRAYPNRLENGNCEVSGYYLGDASLYKVDVVQDAVQLNSLQLTNAASGQLYSIEFVCGADASDLVTVEIEATSASAALFNHVFLHGGEYQTYLYDDTEVLKIGALGSDWTAFTPVVSHDSGSSTNITHTGWYKCNAGELDMITQHTLTGAVGTWSSFRIAPPTSFTIDTAVLAANNFPAGNFKFFDTSISTLYEGNINYVATNLVRLFFTGFTSHTGTVYPFEILSTNLVPDTWASGDVLRTRFTVPVTADSPCPRTPMPLVKQAVTTPFEGVEQSLSGELNCDAASTFNRGGTGMTAGNRSTTSCAITIAAGIFSAQPWECGATIKSSTVQSMGCVCTSATACTIYGPNADYDAYITIKGPR